MVYGVVKQAGGHILVDAAPGAGTTITLLLPLAQRVGVHGTVQEAPQVLLVEDEPLVLKMLQRVFGAQGWGVVAASSAEEALELVGARAPDVLVTDVRLPRQSGLWLCRQLRSSYPDLPVVFISGYTDGLAEKMDPRDALVGKPFSAPEMVQVVRDRLPGGAKVIRSR